VIDVTAPSAPASVRDDGKSATSVSLSWSAASDDQGVTGYQIYRNGSLVSVVQGNQLNFIDTGLAPGSSYRYSLKAVDAAGNLSLSAGNDLSLVASTAEAKGDVSLSAGNNLVLASEANQSSDDVHQGSKHTIDRTTTQVGATVSGDNVSLSAGNNLLAQASTIEAQGNASLQAGGELQLTTADNEEYHYEKSKSSGTFKSKTTEIEQRDVTAQGTTITAGGKAQPNLEQVGRMAESFHGSLPPGRRTHTVRQGTRLIQWRRLVGL
jgi:hypothetical protein